MNIPYKMFRPIVISGLMTVLAACGTPADKATPVPTRMPTSAPVVSIPTTVMPSQEALIRILQASDPTLPGYDPGSAEYADFPRALTQLASLAPYTDNAPVNWMAVAISYPRADAYLAANTLLSFDPTSLVTALPILIGNLDSKQPATRLDSIIVLGAIGGEASCAMGDISSLLWDADPYVRTATAVAMTLITGQELVPEVYQSIPRDLAGHPVAADTPEGSVVGAARQWWLDGGSAVNWHPSYDLCDP